MAKLQGPLSTRQFKPTQTESGENVIVPVQNITKNPLFWVLGLTALTGLLKIWFDVNLLEVVLSGTEKEVIQAVSDSVLIVIVPIIALVIELKRKSVNTIK